MRPSCAALSPVVASSRSRNWVMRRAARRLFQPAQVSTSARASSLSVLLGCLRARAILWSYNICRYKEIQMPGLPRDVLDLIGNTSLVALRHIAPENGARIFLKLE